MSLIQALAPKAFLIVVQIVTPPMVVTSYQPYTSIEECQNSTSFQLAKWMAEVEVVCASRIPDNYPVALGSSISNR
jgi:hypothetical protein